MQHWLAIFAVHEIIYPLDIQQAILTDNVCLLRLRRVSYTPETKEAQ
jgi:hypothetical protein